MAQKAGGVTIAFLGTGVMDVDNATDLIEEYIEATITSDDDPVRFVFPLTTDEFSDTLSDLVDMAKQSDITYEVITHSGDKGRRAFTEISDTAAKTYHVADVYTQIEQILTEAPTAVLEVLWDKEREEELSEILGRFLDAGVDVRDLTDGNAPIAANDEEEVPGEVVEETVDVVDENETAVAEVVHTRSDLEAMSRPEVREIAVRLGLPPRKATAAMIEEIMEAQGGFEEQEEAELVEVDVLISAEPEDVIPQQMEITTGTLTQALEQFPVRLHDVLDQFLTDLGKTIEGLIFNATPEEPQQEPAPTRRLRAR